MENYTFWGLKIIKNRKKMEDKTISITDTLKMPPEPPKNRSKSSKNPAKVLPKSMKI